MRFATSQAREARMGWGGFDWGPDASEEKACQLAIALLASLKGGLCRRTLLSLRGELRPARTDRRYLGDHAQGLLLKGVRQDRRRSRLPRKHCPRPRGLPDLENTGLKSTTYAEEIALAKKYDEVLWRSGNRRENLHRLKAIWNGEEDPASDAVASGTLYRIGGLDMPTNARGTLVKQFESMDKLAAWVCYGRNHSRLTGISDASAKTICDSRPGFIKYFGGEKYIPEHDSRDMSLSEIPTSRGDTAQQSFKSALCDGEE